MLTDPVPLRPPDPSDAAPSERTAWCRARLAEAHDAGWPTVAPHLSADHHQQWHDQADLAAALLREHGRHQVGHDGPELVWVSRDPWCSIVATFGDGGLTGLTVETVTSVVARAASGGVAGAAPPRDFWRSELTTTVGPLGVALDAGDGWVVVDHTGRRVILDHQSAAAPVDEVDPGGHDDAPFVAILQSVGDKGVVVVGCRQGGLGWDLTRRHPLVLAGHLGR